MKNNQFVRFIIVGGIAALVNLVSRYGLNYFMAYGYAIIIAYIMGMIVAFTLSRTFVFLHGPSYQAHTQFIRFTLVNLVAAAQVWLISVGFAEYIFPGIGFSYHPYDVAHLIGVLFPVFTSYLGHKYFSFSPKYK